MYKRLLFSVLSLAVAGCGGGGSSGPGLPAVTLGQSATTKVTLSFTLKKPAAAARTIATVDAATLSVSAVVNALAPQIFNVSPGTGGCTASPPITCTETVNAPIGSDTFTITAYSAGNAGGVALDTGVAVHTISNNSTNSVTLSLMPLVSINADSGVGSLRYAIADATAGDTITFGASALPTITLASPIVVTTNNLTIAGPGSGSLVINGSSSGAFEVDAGTAATFSGIKFSGGTCSSGCAFVGTGTMTLISDDFESNCASAQGGAISAGAGSSVTISNSTLNFNCATSAAGNAYGGAIYSNGTLNISGSSFASNTVTSPSTTMSAAGGAIYADSASAVVLLNDTFTSNAAHETGATGYGSNAMGGAIYSKGPLTVHGGAFTSNTAADAIVQYSFGGAIDSTGTGGVLTIDATGASGNPLFTLNSAENGGAIEADSGSVMTNTLSNVSFTHNSTLAPTYGIGGALHMETTGPWNMSGLTFSNNTASSIGGAMEYNAIGSVALSNSSFTSNSVTDSNAYNAGGAIDMELGAASPVDTVTNVTFTGNTSNGIGGAVRDDVGYADVYQYCTFANNSSVLSGGAFYDQSGVVITRSNFSGNASTGSLLSSPAGGTGGAIFISMVSTDIATTTIDSNTATDAGGGVFIEGSPGYPSAASIQISTLSNNSVTAPGYGGGGIYINNEAVGWTVSLANDTLFGNSAPNADGGGIYSAAPNPGGGAQPVFIDFVTFSNNSALGNGGNLYAFAAPTLTPSSVGRRPQHRRLQPQSERRRPLGALCSTCALWLANSVLVNGTAASGADFNNASNVAGNYDYFGTAIYGAPFAWGGSANQYGISAMLGTLQNNGGPTGTMAPAAGSPLVTSGVPLGSCDQAADQRGHTRPGGANCTAGAYEFP